MAGKTFVAAHENNRAQDMKNSFIIVMGCLIASALSGWAGLALPDQAGTAGSSEVPADDAELNTLTADSGRSTKLIAVGEWSEPVADAEGYVLRGRLMLFDTPHFTNQFPGGAPKEYWGNAPLFLELENLSPRMNNSLAVYFALGDALACEMRDSRGKPVAMQKTNFSGPSWHRQYWVVVPFNGAVRLRADPQLGGFTAKPKGVRILFGMHAADPIPVGDFLISAGDTNAFYLSGNFSPPTDHPAPPGSHAWQGKLLLPAMKITAPKP
jgi:hypothetical protein